MQINPSRVHLRLYFSQYQEIFKDFVQPKKRGVERGTIRTVLRSYTIADIFLDTRKGLISRRKLQKTGSSVKGKKYVESLLIWIPLPKT